MMSIMVGEATFRRVFEQIAPHAAPSARELSAIVQFAELVAGADFKTDPSEHDLLESLIEHLAALTEISPRSIARIGQLPSDAEERQPVCTALASRLGTTELRELAFAFAYLVVVTDHELAPAEIEALDDAQQALEIDDDRATELTLTIAELVTPGIAVREEPRHVT
jgi:hypothetical protein